MKDFVAKRRAERAALDLVRRAQKLTFEHRIEKLARKAAIGKALALVGDDRPKPKVGKRWPRGGRDFKARRERAVGVVRHLARGRHRRKMGEAEAIFHGAKGP